jgi:hypothetical protein
MSGYCGFTHVPRKIDYTEFHFLFSLRLSFHAEILIADEAIVDVGASNVETFLMLMSQYAGSDKRHQDFYLHQ